MYLSWRAKPWRTNTWLCPGLRDFPMPSMETHILQEWLGANFVPPNKETEFPHPRRLISRTWETWIFVYLGISGSCNFIAKPIWSSGIPQPRFIYYFHLHSCRMTCLKAWLCSGPDFTGSYISSWHYAGSSACSVSLPATKLIWSITSLKRS